MRSMMNTFLIALAMASAIAACQTPETTDTTDVAEDSEATSNEDTASDEAAPEGDAGHEEDAADGAEEGASGDSDAAMTAETLPETAMGPEIPQDTGYLVEEIENGLYWVTDGGYQAMFLTTGEGVIVVDAPPSIGENVVNAVADVTDEPITHVIYSHGHADHIGAAGVYPDGAIVIAHEAVLERLERNNTSDRLVPFGTFLGGGDVPLPTITFDDAYTLEVGSQTLELSYGGPNHQEGNIFVYAPDQKVLMFVDVVFPGWSMFKNMALAEDVPGFIRSHDQILEFDFDTYVGGHLTRLGTREDVEIQREYVMDIRDNTATAIQTTDIGAIGQEVGFGNAWRLFDAYLDAIAQSCADATEAEWQDRLGGVDVFTIDHCYVMSDSLRVD